MPISGDVLFALSCYVGNYGNLNVFMRVIFRIDFVEERPGVRAWISTFIFANQRVKNSQVEEMDTEIRIFFKNALGFQEVVRGMYDSAKRNCCFSMFVNPLICRINYLSKQNFRKFHIYRDPIDNIIGFVHSRNVQETAEIIQVLLPVSIVPEVMSANELLKQFTNQHRSVAVVVDEFGGTADGWSTSRDRRNFRWDQDEHDVPEEIEKKINDKKRILFSGRLEIDYLNNKYELNLNMNLWNAQRISIFQIKNIR